MRNIPTFVLKVALSVLFIPVLLYVGVLLLKGVPIIESVSTYVTIIVAIVGITAVPYTYTLFQAWQLLRFIDNNEAFSLKSVLAIRKIKYVAILIGIMYVMALPFTYLVADATDAPGLILVNLVIGFASLVIAVFTMILQKLLYEAIQIKEENDLTV